ncbi:acyl-CoA Delta-9 desaturase-like [Malaya genurostris]|uniref:acyl-CoA Delta-9 desaturase-like n=1 Tax=Malaya genurostris TaxID=325434 RepID=UPI0026F3F142|nr:acyl-CoA Delta-9 desaturase-like [Malaya genurostris]XP_058453871.1 acyl-CoA Delta-9 desaturase-like [Malaya genurostris]
MAPHIVEQEDPVGSNCQNGSTVRQRVDGANLVSSENNNNYPFAKPSKSTVQPAEDEFRAQIRWPDFFAQLFLHVGFLIGLCQVVTLQAKFYTVVWTILLVWGSGFGITAGAHRLWSHKSYKAKWPLRVLLMFLFTICGQRDAYTWAHDHRVHHKYSETDADPHNAKRGFFFAHVGWVFLTPHPDVVAKRKAIDMSDLEADPIVMWQKKYYLPLFALLVIGFPVLVPYYFWAESLWVAFWVCFTMRFTTTLNIAFFVNSVAHMFGNRPYDKTISPVENLSVAIAAMGEGWHNYHHVFPWDYKTGELKGYMFNVTTGFIDAFARLGWAYERKSVSPTIIERRAAKYGDGTRFLTDEYAHKDAVWGFGDQDIQQEDLEDILRLQE